MAAAPKSTGALALDRSAVHLAVDLQRLFAEPGPWFVPWMPKVLPRIAALARRHPERTVLTRFIPPREPADLPGAWRDYYRHWRAMTQENLDARLLGLVEPLAALVPPARLCDKAVYSAFGNPGLARWLAARGARTLIVTGGETDVCVLATVMAAVDRGFHVVLPTDALCSGNDTSHDALLTLYRQRFGQQITTSSTEEILSRWE
jgi:nicotinamidase-related amidase